MNRSRQAGAPWLVLYSRQHLGVTGGGTTREVRRWRLGPRNLARAVRALDGHRTKTERVWGNIGCGRTWLNLVDGTGSCILHEDAIRDPGHPGISAAAHYAAETADLAARGVSGLRQLYAEIRRATETENTPPKRPT